jgi:thiol-disulfide isomerase/thioredoxin
MKRALTAAVVIVGALILAAAGLYAWNTVPPTVSIPSAESARGGKPYVVKLHAQWCPKCLMTKGAWTELQEKYSGRAHFIVFDFTNQRTTDASGVEANRLGLGEFFDSAGGTGSVIVLDGVTKDVRSWLGGVRDVSDYSAAIDEALRSR